MSRPNILLLHTDQQRFDTIAALGASHMITPNLDRLVREGTTFTRAYSANPVCMPARHDLITGATARHHGYYHNQGTPIRDYSLATLPRMLTAAGYQTAAVGKMHFRPEREHHGFSHMFLMEELPSCRENDAYLQYLEENGYGHIRCQHGVRPLFYHTPQRSRVPEEHHGSAWVAHKTIELIETKRDRPFFIFASWVGPHPPYYVPEHYLDMYRDKPIPAPCPVPEGSERQVPVSPENPATDSLRLRRMREAYCAAVTLIDTHIGRILAALEETGQLDNTLILFTTDHGEMLGDRGTYQKHMPYEGSAHIPLIARGPGFGPGARWHSPVVTWDVSATILAAANVDVPATHPLVGCDLSSADVRDPDRLVVFHHGHGRGRYVASVSQTHKFVHWFNGGEEELYDLVNDPWEQTNLLPDPTGHVAEIADGLLAACMEFEEEQGVAANVDQRGFVDQPFQPVSSHLASLYPPWSYRQYPPWMIGYSAADLEAIEDEMRDCLREETTYLFRDPEWRRDATATWERIGGDPAAFERIFKDADAIADQASDT